ncbi:MAG: PIG-L family deacetylase [Acidimicrobiia bacterium]|nr:PIG-L family deacetylase [Acidimicrobiia bacterium]NNL28842.1 mycothiol conjugate amidase Mca [Acidimicrobiia bacterium]
MNLAEERRLLVVHAHPDDEASKTAGTVATYADQGVRCVLITATGGEEGEVLNPVLDQPETQARLAEIRREELDASVRILGYTGLVLLGYRDSGMPDSEANARPDAFVNIDENEVVGRLVEIIRTEKPQVILGYDDHRHYQHPDHLRVHVTAIAAFEAAGDPDAFPEAGPIWEPARLYAPKFSRAAISRMHDALIDLGEESPFDRFLDGWDPAQVEPIHARIKLTAETLNRARMALRAHATQVDPNGFWFKVPPDLVLELNPYEEYELLAARVPQPDPVVDDLFAGLDERHI